MLAAQADLLHRLRTDPGMLYYHAGGWDVDPQARRKNGPQLIRMVRKGRGFRVSDEWSILVQSAASKLDESDVWDSTLAPREYGIVRFDEPLPVSTGAGRVNRAHWLMWGRSDAGGTCLFLWNDHHDPDDEAVAYFEEMDRHERRRLGRWGSIGGHAHIPDGATLGPVELDWNYYDHGLDPNIIEAQHATTNMARYLHALWLMMDQPLTVTETDRLPPTSTKAARAAGITPEVHSVRLRRGAGTRGTGESKVEWSRRWLVDGHWRWQAYGPGYQQRRRVWIAPFVKGPADKPLMITKKVYDVG